MRVGYFDCFSGISGDMTLGALVDAGVDHRAIEGAVASLGLPGSLSFETVRKGGFRATHAKVETPREHAHRHWHHIEAIIDKGRLTDSQKDLARKIFLKLGEAEARVHGTELAKIHFHEVGALDSIMDIVGSAVGLDLLGVDRFEASPVPPGRGWIRAAHGRMALPAPATAEILKGVPLAESPAECELTTPTGAAILATIVERFGPLPAITIESIGLGAGTRDLPEQANVLRLFVGTVNLPPSGDRIWVLETNLDDLPGEVVGYTTIKLMEAGALDAFVTPIQMKKNRPAVMISVLCDEPKIPAMEEILFRETATLGIRRYPVSRHKLKRQATEVETPFGPIRGKLGWIENRPPTFSPEYDDCARAASAHDVALREVFDAANAAYRARAQGEAAEAQPQPSSGVHAAQPAHPYDPNPDEGGHGNHGSGDHDDTHEHPH
ncbi:nickel pincer cofactor biosynthesis protein LarC [Aquisphaera giovannonii]|uniref:nickel pincer cofactor biosynthesis protein LarC n=1 Tax=Aquisphaera giovannonii TaxID=406548 RepID=UPI0011DFD56C|nr:nickel pincer cofactor biosynthesis protein LarC [Aquisphaera giovannonii]